ncbi:hypothetical protein SAMN04515618_11795 [Collimonas sp. OK307]|nr:hypothetical protein SAMN04515618_11795 [Collimonas sp. OK307]
MPLRTLTMVPIQVRGTSMPMSRKSFWGHVWGHGKVLNRLNPLFMLVYGHDMNPRLAKESAA